MKLSLAFLASSSLSLASALNVLVPLYIYPSSSSDWAPLVSAISSHTGFNFQIIINPNSGPGSGEFPDSAYIDAIAELRAFSNVELLGYVHVLWGSRDSSEISRDIDVYAGWQAHSGKDIHVDGIFFDEAPTGSDYVSYMASLSSHASSVIPPSSKAIRSSIKTKVSLNVSSSGATTIFNMGTTPETNDYFADCTQVITAEITYGSSSDSALANSIPSGYSSQSSAILHDFNGDDNALDSVVKAAKDAGMVSLGVTADCCYNTLNPVNGKGGIGAVADAFAAL